MEPRMIVYWKLIGLIEITCIIDWWKVANTV